VARRGRKLDPIAAHRRRLVLETAGIVLVGLIALVLVVLALRR
jgi:hypothetical protein